MAEAYRALQARQRWPRLRLRLVQVPAALLNRTLHRKPGNARRFWLGPEDLISLRPAPRAPQLMRNILAVQVPLLATRAGPFTGTCTLRTPARPARFLHLEPLRFFATDNVIRIVVVGLARIVPAIPPSVHNARELEALSDPRNRAMVLDPLTIRCDRT